MAQPTRTMGPLHFEDLEPKRFEDLVRQLVYDFKVWRRLEATGRAGSDDGFDVRGYEIVGGQDVPSDEPSDESLPMDRDDRLWLVQCKREKTIGPKKLAGYVDDIKLNETEKLYGIAFAAACDFSKTARDTFGAKCDALGVKEWHLWGKAEIEDMLMRPANDGLLFAYFGISLTIRKRSQRTEVRARLAMKRKAIRLLDSKRHMPLLIRPADATTYPYWDDVRFDAERPWRTRPYRGLEHDGLQFCLERYFAFISDDGQAWDAAMAVNEALPSRHDDPWGTDGFTRPLRGELYDLWNKLPERNRAWFEVLGIVAFEDVIDIDEHGDEYVYAPHIYVVSAGGKVSYKRHRAEVENVESRNKQLLHPTSASDRRIVFFAKHLRDKGESPGASAEVSIC